MRKARGDEVYLRALELQGFKSFPDKTVLTFGEDITGIVGPNGSGKSNISDAIRWVMGEQSTRELRSGRMEDVIFGGTQTRAPVGFAEVSLIIDNSEHVLPLEENEVMVTRRYYRSGESEFYINKRSVRLRDINELFMDTGMGREGYSVIGQGKIDEIISSKSEDRREVFESAAGIAKYRRRKEEAEKKIANTDANLLRINDKISELELQVEPLRVQSEKARKYIVLRDELKTVEVSLWADTLDRLRENAQKNDGDYYAAKNQLEEATARQDELYAKGEELAERMREHDISAEQRRQELSELENMETELQGAIALIDVNIENNRENVRRLQEEDEKQTFRTESLKTQIDEHRQRLVAIGAERAALEEKNREIMDQAADAAASSGDLEDVIALLLAKQEKLKGDIESGRVRLSALEAAVSEMDAGARDDNREYMQSMQALEQARGEYGEICAALEKAGEELVSVDNAIRGYTMRVESRENRRTELEKQVMDLRMELNSTASRVKLLGDMEKEYEGYSKAVKSVMQESGRGMLRGIHGPLANLIKTDKRYTVAVEIALGGAAQNIVVDNEENAKAAINDLKRKDGGRATFLPISVIRGRSMTEDLSKNRGYVGIASELCRFDKRYTDIVRNFLGRTVVADNLDNAIAMAKACSNRFRIVTLDGQVINAGGSMTGGSIGRNVGILSRAEELERLKVQFGKLEQDYAEKENQLAEAVRQVQSAAYELETALGEKRILDDEVLRRETEKTHKAELLSTLETAARESESQRGRLEQRMEENRSEILQINQELEKLNSQLSEVQAELEEKAEGQSQLRSRSDTLVESLAESAKQDAVLAAEKSALERTIDQLTQLLLDADTSGRDREKTLFECENREKQLKLDLEEKQTKLSELSLECDARREQVREMTGLRLEMEAERTRRDKDIQDCSKDIMNLTGECARLEQKKVAADLEEQQIIEKLWDTYELNYSTLAGIRVQLESIAEAKRSIAELKRKISSLGSPNLDSIEEYKRVSERYDYLISQRDDVQSAKDELEKIIGDITSQMKSIFSTQFAAINEHFSSTFVEMFGGGKASLELEDENDILNCNIDIKVQPPGKTLKNISLLSGGEKAFTAIALYFAMLKVRPTPFCMIDEIDASLDEPNVVRFSEYLRRMSQKTQFIVITHRRSTMEGADVLYGVTMQQKGVSKMLTINLTEAEQEFLRQE